MNPVGELVSGGLALKDWLGSGGSVVPQDVAESRAEICVSCPENRGELWWERMLKDPIAAAMRSQLEAKNKMALRVSVEDKINVCRQCGCCLRLIVWQTDEQIRSHTPVEDAPKYPDFCWKLAIISP